MNKFVNTQEMPLLAFLLERICSEVLLITRLLPVTVPVGSPFLDVLIRNRKRSRVYLTNFLFSSVASRKKCTQRAVDNADDPVQQAYFALCIGLHVE